MPKFLKIVCQRSVSGAHPAESRREHLNVVTNRDTAIRMSIINGFQTDARPRIIYRTSPLPDRSASTADIYDSWVVGDSYKFGIMVSIALSHPRYAYEISTWSYTVTPGCASVHSTGHTLCGPVSKTMQPALPDRHSPVVGSYSPLVYVDYLLVLVR